MDVTSSLLENKESIRITEDMDKTGDDWYEIEVVKKMEKEELFVDDNFFIFDKTSRKSLKDRKVMLLSKGMKVDMEEANRKKETEEVK
jgi:hypothetical protein